MSAFTLGMVAGLFGGAIGTLFLLVAVYNIPDGDYMRSRFPERWHSIALIVVLIILSGGLFAFLNLRRAAFATSMLLLLVFIAARLRGMVVSWIALAVATIVLCMVLPPSPNLFVADSQDRILLVFFVICGTVGTRLIAQKS